MICHVSRCSREFTVTHLLTTFACTLLPGDIDRGTVFWYAVAGLVECGHPYRLLQGRAVEGLRRRGVLRVHQNPLRIQEWGHGQPWPHARSGL